eukprot:12962902-Alexandrium_andersonii.AAC.1
MPTPSSPLARRTAPPRWTSSQSSRAPWSSAWSLPWARALVSAMALPSPARMGRRPRLPPW